MEYSKRAVGLALIMNLAYKGKNALEKFLVQQNLIQYNLMLLIRARTAIPDKDFIGRLENQTLGNLIDLYKICANRSDEEISLIVLLKKYNKKRRYLVHNIIKDANYKKIQMEAKIANENGSEILKCLMSVLLKEVSK